MTRRICRSGVWTALAIAISAAACASNTSAEPQCEAPAPLRGEATPVRDGMRSYIVVYHDGTAAGLTTERLAAKYGFTARHVFETALAGFAADLTPGMLAGIRCDEAVRQVEYDHTATIPR